MLNDCGPSSPRKGQFREIFSNKKEVPVLRIQYSRLYGLIYRFQATIVKVAQVSRSRIKEKILFVILTLIIWMKVLPRKRRFEPEPVFLYVGKPLRYKMLVQQS